MKMGVLRRLLACGVAATSAVLGHTLGDMALNRLPGPALQDSADIAQAGARLNR